MSVPPSTVKRGSYVAPRLGQETHGRTGLKMHFPKQPV
ncbi:hypothetical protein GMO_00250 [Gluconobacter morbifer G707]|uniref:Uncharacterized protein n=1 Tax=Gluconobacter morbifer G707 TaxID=1088869 RepID=G6XEW0_9PROT|nr:hypothetical protein GMO_00250 [Gluconobacter morbifer G707]